MTKTKTISLLLTALLCVNALHAQQKWCQYGLKVGTSFPTNRNYSVDGDLLQALSTADFGLFFRAGKFVYGEVGIGYTFLKGNYGMQAGNGDYLFNGVYVATHHLQIPVKLVGNIPMGRASAFLPHAGIVYQPLLKVTANSIGFSKSTLACNPVLLAAGFDLKFGPIVLGTSYRYSLHTFFQNKAGKHPQYINICAGIQL